MSAPTAGYWMLRVVRGGPEVCARIWLCDHEPGEPKNKMDRPHWQGQDGLELYPPGQIWSMVEFCEATPEERAAITNPPEVTRAPRNGRKPALMWAALAKWKQERARRITPAEYETELAWHRWAEANAPDHPEFTWRKPIDKTRAPVPKFGGQTKDRERKLFV